MLTPLLAVAMLLGGLEEFAGTWKGECKSVSLGLPPTIAVEVTIAPSGSVSGRVGGAEIVNGRFRPRSTWTEPRAFNHFEYRIDFQLSGAISEGMTRTGGRINLVRQGDELRGWFVSDGPYLAGRERVQLMTRDLVLKRFGDPQR